MEGLEYYKTLVSDDEVINALIKDSKAREGALEKSRVRPNLQFFQRTVTNLVSSNNRVTEKQEQVKAKEKEKNKVYRPRKVYVRRKLPIEYIKEILSTKIEFVKSSQEAETSDSISSGEKKDSKELGISTIYQSGQSLKQKRIFNQKKTPFQQIREILTNNVNKPSTTTSISPSTPTDFKNKLDCMSNGDMDTSSLESLKKTHIISNCTDIITVSDSDSSLESDTCIEIDKINVDIGLRNSKNRKKRK